MKNNTIGANPALAAILKSVKTTEKEYKTTQLQPKKKKKKIVKHNLANFELDRNERDHLIKKERAFDYKKVFKRTKKENKMKDDPKLVYKYDKTKDRIVANPVENPPNIIKEINRLKEVNLRLTHKIEEVKDRPNDVLVKHYKTENERLANKISELTIVLVRAVEDLNHLIEAKEIEKSIIKEMKDGIYSRWKQL